jgi:hypothetical protein
MGISKKKTPFGSIKGRQKSTFDALSFMLLCALFSQKTHKIGGLSPNELILIA